MQCLSVNPCPLSCLGGLMLDLAVAAMKPISASLTAF